MNQIPDTEIPSDDVCCICHREAKVVDGETCDTYCYGHAIEYRIVEADHPHSYLKELPLWAQKP